MILYFLKKSLILLSSIRNSAWLLLKRDALLVVLIVMLSLVSVMFHMLLNNKWLGEKHHRGTDEDRDKEQDAESLLSTW